MRSAACSVQRGIGATGPDDIKPDVTQTRENPEMGRLETILQLSLLVTWWMILNWVEPSRTPLNGTSSACTPRPGHHILL